MNSKFSLPLFTYFFNMKLHVHTRDIDTITSFGGAESRIIYGHACGFQDCGTKSNGQTGGKSGRWGNLDDIVTES